MFLTLNKREHNIIIKVGNEDHCYAQGKLKASGKGKKNHLLYLF